MAWTHGRTLTYYYVANHLLLSATALGVVVCLVIKGYAMMYEDEDLSVFDVLAAIEALYRELEDAEEE